MGRLAGKTILVTGAAGAVGGAVRAAIAREAGTTIACDREPRDGIDHAFDVADEAGWLAAIGAVERTRDRLDGLVNAAGLAALGNIEATDYATWRNVMAVNLDGAFLGCKHAFALLRRRGGAIVNLSSVFGHVGSQNIVAYAASKGGLRALTRSVALHGAVLKPPVRCNSVSPAYLEGAMFDGMVATVPYPDVLKRFAVNEIPLGRLGTAAEVAELCIYLLSDDAGFVTGADFLIDGGQTAR
jgi:3(or 17)beta-hydroxysteroid dehydrogenase